MINGNIPKQLLAFFFPIWFGTFFQQMYNTVDAVVVGNYVGTEALASVGGPAAAIINLLVGFFVGISSGCSVVIAQYYGARDDENAKRSVNTAISFAIASGVILMVIGIPLSPYLLKWMGTPEEILVHSSAYLRIYFYGVIFNLIYNVGSSILRAMGDSKRPLYFLIAASVCNVVLDILFVVGFGMGVEGVAWATIISQFLSAILVLVSLKLSYPQFEFTLKKLSVDMKILLQMFKIGIPTGFQSIMYSLSNVIIQSDINSFGTNVIAAWTAYGKIDAVYWMTVNSFGIAITTFTGQNFGAKKYDRVKESIKVCMIMTTVVTIILSALTILAAPFVYRLFCADIDVIQIGIYIVKIQAPFYFAYVAVEIMSGAMRGVGDVFTPTMVTLFGICILRVLWSFIVVPQSHTLATVCFSYPFTWFVTSIMFIIYYKRGKWLKIPKEEIDNTISNS
ncbi:MAG: MATE family efflux transporter [Oscillospiraceae bacterium]